MTVICPTFLLESGTFFREYLLLLQFDDFLYLFFKVWSKDFLAYAFFDFINAPETSSVQFLEIGSDGAIVSGPEGVYQFLLYGRLEYITFDEDRRKISNAQFLTNLTAQGLFHAFSIINMPTYGRVPLSRLYILVEDIVLPSY